MRKGLNHRLVIPSLTFSAHSLRHSGSCWWNGMHRPQQRSHRPRGTFLPLQPAVPHRSFRLRDIKLSFLWCCQGKLNHTTPTTLTPLVSQTRDEMTAAAMGRLRQHGLTVDNILSTPDEQLSKLINNVSFYNRKTEWVCPSLPPPNTPNSLRHSSSNLCRYIKRTTQILKDKYNGITISFSSSPPLSASHTILCPLSRISPVHTYYLHPTQPTSLKPLSQFLSLLFFFPRRYSFGDSWSPQATWSGSQDGILVYAVRMEAVQPASPQCYY